ncbi:DUF4167 domain-containing protein [uncultured Sphingomonas sp.]|uniref:DUF4167 domain-containing protein n=1 Tax=uncultured Sphingomonas sp. TaxID=158754 RepID=UPI0035CADA73
MINNRQQTGRRRGRGGQRPGGGNGGGGGGAPGRAEGGNRIDNRARGNAAQLYEKYKSMASEAQRQGDRVNTEYYLQFADHYFRVLSESRARFDDQQPRAQQNRGDEFDRQRNGRDEFGDDQDADGPDTDGDDFGDEGDMIRPGDQMPGDRMVGDRIVGDRVVEQSRQRPQQQARPQANGSQGGDGGNRPYEDRRPRRDEEDRRPRQNDRERQGGQPQGDGRPERDDRPRAQAPASIPPEVRTPEARAEAIEPSLPLVAPNADAPQPRRRGRPRKEPVAETRSFESDGSEPSGFDADRLPPALGVAAANGTADGDAADEGEVKPRRRRARAVEAPAAE